LFLSHDFLHLIYAVNSDLSLLFESFFLFDI